MTVDLEMERNTANHCIQFNTADPQREAVNRMKGCGASTVGVT